MAMKRTTLATVAAIASIGVVSAADAAGDLQAGKVLSAACVACHGANGQGMAQYPALAGKKADQLVQGAKGLQIRKTRQRIHEGDGQFAQRPGYRKCGSVYASRK